MNGTISAVIVTYGDRWHCLSKVLSRLCGDPVIRNVIVVDNDSKYDLGGLCADAGYPHLEVITMPVNTGSAGGFAAGVAAACRYPSEYIMLFDDDTLPGEGAIDTLLARLIEINKAAGSIANAVIPNRKSQLVFLRNKLRKLPWLAEESIVGLNIFNFLQRHLSDSGSAAAVIEEKTLDYGLAAYGGLLFHKKMCDVIGYPDSEYILYYDDIDYTNRILANNGKVWLCADLFMDDIEDNYSSNMMNRPFIGFIMADSDTKVYYQLRNQIYFESRCMSKRKWLFLINAAVFSLLAALISIVLFRFGRLKVVSTAIAHGLMGRRGANPAYPLA